MSKGIIAFVALIAVVVIGGVLTLSGNPEGNVDGSAVEELPAPENYEYYWGNGCPNCKVVDDFYKDWTKPDNVVLDKYEVWYNRDNARRMLARVNGCGWDPDSAGVPFMVVPGGECLVGDEPIIEHFKGLESGENE